MKLTIMQRLMLFNILPPEGSFATLRAVRQLREALSLTETEIKEINFRQNPDDPNGVIWDRGLETIPDIEITEQGKQIISDRLTTLDQNGKLRMEHYEIYELFVTK